MTAHTQVVEETVGTIEQGKDVEVPKRAHDSLEAFRQIGNLLDIGG